MAQYNPNSNFYTDLLKLKSASQGDPTADSFGPVIDFESEKFRVTSFVRSTGVAEVFAVTSGQIAIVQQSGVGNEEKLNLIIKNSSISFSPLKIKYFIYRGINKSDLIDNSNNIIPENSSDPNQPAIIKRLWRSFKEFNADATSFPASFIGYGIGTGETLLDNLFYKNINFICDKGEHLANFSDKLGFDIILDKGDYSFDNQDILFELNIDYARKNEFIFDLTDSRLTTDFKIKRYKESIHQFVDVAAFWGSHIESGILTVNGVDVSSVSEISPILKKYQSENKIYIYIQGENNRSYGYYDVSPKRKIYGFEGDGEENSTYGWPILIKESNSNKELLLEYHIENNIGTNDNNINSQERQVSYELISRKNSYIITKNGRKDLLLSKNRQMVYNLNVKTNSVITIKADQELPTGLQLLTGPTNNGLIFGTPLRTEVKTLTFIITEVDGFVREEQLTFYIDALNINLEISFDSSTNKGCADIIFINSYMKQNFPLENFYDNLWIANVRNSIEYGTPNEMYSTTIDRSRNVNLYYTIGENSIIQNRIVFDIGRKKTSTGMPENVKKRRLYVANIKQNSGLGQEFKNLNIDNVSSFCNTTIKSKSLYFLTLFNDSNFSIYKGKFNDGSKSISSLSVFNEVSLFRKNSYMLLGITEEEYQSFDIPTNSDNVFYILKEQTIVNENVRKFELGIRCERADSSGKVTLENLFPENEIIIYSVDDLFFFSEKFSEYQNFYETFAPVKLEFRTMPANSLGIQPFDGEFGFDWVRNGDNYYASSTGVLTSSIDFYKGIKNGYEPPQTKFGLSEYGSKDKAYKFLKRQYLTVATSVSSNDTGVYTVPYLTLFSKDYQDKFTNSPDSDGYLPPLPPYEATLRILIKNPNSRKGIIKFISETKDLVSFDKNTIINLQDNTNKAVSLALKISCLKDCDEKINIKALYFPPGSNLENYKQAQLAGLLVLNRNNSSKRKNIDTILVNCKTDIIPDGVGEFFKFTDNDKKRFYQLFYQCLLIPKVNIFTLLLDSSHTDYAKFKVSTPGTFVYQGGIPPLKILNIDKFIDEFKFLRDELPNGYFKNLKLYSFQLYGRSPSGSTPAVGLSNGIGNKEALVYTGHLNFTVPHEALHASSLYHTHQDKEVSGAVINIKDPDQKFVFKDVTESIDYTDSSDNIMSYFSNRIHVWNWQTEIIHKFLSK